jgi:Na+-translocating ferredoxin:NAD+ oxidoreductase RnfD subunit
LLVLGIYGVQFFGQGTGLVLLVFLPLVAVVADLLFQAVRFPAIRVPDSAIATGLFLALILPPTAPLLLGATAVVGAVTLRHILRYRGRPVFNPAVTGALLGYLLFGLAPAWWVAVGPTVGLGSVGEFAMVALGAVLLLRNWRAWRLPATFFVAYGFIAVVQHLLVGTSTDPRILFLQAVDPVTIFFGLYMVTEPRTAPTALRFQTLYAGIIGVTAALLPIFFPSLGIFLALITGNLLALALRRSSEESASTAVDGAPVRSGRRTAPRSRTALSPKAPTRWPKAYRVTAGVLGVITIAAVAGITGVGHSSTPLFQLPNPGSSGGGTANCARDNPAIPAPTLATLHKVLGPSVILSYDSRTGAVTFYDPVNQVTVTETDLYEDYGYADFNGDDYAVSGCAG